MVPGSHGCRVDLHGRHRRRIAVHPGNTGHPGTAPGYIACGSVIAAGCVFMVVGQLVSRLIVTGDGLSWRYLLGTRSVARADIDEVRIVPARSVGRWYSPAVRSGGRVIWINSVIGSRRCVERVVTARAVIPRCGAAVLALTRFRAVSETMTASDIWRSGQGREMVFASNPDNVLSSKARRLDAESSMGLKRERHRETEQDWRAEDDNAATAPGEVCALCESAITARQEARRRVDGRWIHEACPRPLSR